MWTPNKSYLAERLIEGEIIPHLLGDNEKNPASLPCKDARPESNHEESDKPKLFSSVQSLSRV